MCSESHTPYTRDMVRRAPRSLSGQVSRHVSRHVSRCLATFGLLGLGLGALTVTPACRTQSGPDGEASAKKTPRPEVRAFTAEGTELFESFLNDAPDDAPIVVAIHGRGDSPKNFRELYRRFGGKVHLLVPKAYAPFHTGFSWFDLREGMTDAELGASVGAALERLHRAVASVVGGKRYIVTGFSQGGILSYGFASRYAAEVRCALPVAGSLPGPLLPGPKQQAAKTRAFHGDADDVIAVKWGFATVETFQREGADARLTTYPGLGHSISDGLLSDYFAALTECVGAP